VEQTGLRLISGTVGARCRRTRREPSATASRLPIDCGVDGSLRGAALGLVRTRGKNHGRIRPHGQVPVLRCERAE